MKRFYVTHEALSSSPFPFADAVKLAEITNKRFAIWNDFKNLILIVEAEQKPEDSPTHNVFWHEEMT